jgi:sec-independent protein translocase protein TatA
MPQLGVPELIIILVIVVIIFGVGRLPEIGSALGKAIHGFRESSTGQDAEKSSTTKDAGEKETTDK